MRGKYFIAGSIVVLFAAGVLEATTITLAPDRDNTIYEETPPDGSALSNGQGSYIFAGNTGGNFSRRALLRFDLAGSVPDGATVTGVSLKLHMSRSQFSTRTVSMHRVLSDWGEAGSKNDVTPGQGAPAQIGDATWEHTFFDDQFWTTPGGDFDTTASASASIGGIGFYTWESTPGLTTDVQNWLDDPSSNFGWILIGDESTSMTAKRFDSRENVTVTNRPVLTIDFEAAIVLGDMDGNGVLDAFDVDDFELALADPAAYDAAHPGLDRVALGDIDLSGGLDAFDVDNFESLLVGGGAAVPEPATAAVMVLSVIGLLRRPRW